MFERLLTAAFENGGEVFVYMKGFGNPFKGRVLEMDGEHFTLFQNGRTGTVLWAFRMLDVLSCGLHVGTPTHDEPMDLEGVTIRRGIDPEGFAGAF